MTRARANIETARIAEAIRRAEAICKARAAIARPDEALIVITAAAALGITIPEVQRVYDAQFKRWGVC